MNPLNILIITLGSRGDVQPYVALAVGLKAAGHQVTFCTSALFESFITERGLNYRYMNNGFIELMRSDVGRTAVEDLAGVMGGIKTTLKLFQRVKPVLRKTLTDSWKAAQSVAPDLMILGSKGAMAEPIAEKLGIPLLMAMPMPQMVPTAEIPSVGFPQLNIGGGYNRFTYKVVSFFMSIYDRMLNDFRQNVLGLRKKIGSVGMMHRADGRPIPQLHCFSRHIVARPNDWPDYAYVTGYWFLGREEGWQPPADLKAFIDEADAPVYIGFGSIAGKNAKRLSGVVLDALKQAKVRGILATGWGGLEAHKLPESLFQIEDAPHDCLFPRMAVVVHHGGAGTTAAGLRAGCPTVICPFFGDQPFWGRRVYELGVGVKPIAQKKITVKKLADAIQEALRSQPMRSKAQALGAKIRAEDGIANAIAIVEDVGRGQNRIEV